MQRKICPHCGLINSSNDQNCKKCKKSLFSKSQNNGETQDFDKKVRGLGELQFESQVSVMAIVVLVLGVGISIASIVGVSPLRKTLPRDEFFIIVLLLVVIPVFCSIGAYYLITQHKVTIYQNGLVYHNKTTIFWREVAECTESIEWLFFNGIPIGRGRALMLKTHTGEEYILGQELAGLGDKIAFIRKKLTGLNQSRL